MVMQLLQPSDHTLLLNLGIFLGHPNDVISPVLLQKGYPLKELSLRIPTPGYKPGSPDSAAVPDLGYSSSAKNAVLFLEAKGGGTDDNQIERFQYVHNNPNTLMGIRNNLDVVSKNLIIDFGLLCSDIDKVKQNHNQTAIPFPVIFYDKKNKNLRYENFNTIDFKNNQISSAFSSPLPVPRIPILFIPFGPTEFNENMPFIVKNLLMLVFEASQNLKKFERMPTIEELLLIRFPMLRMMGKEEFDQLVKITNTVLQKLFPDDSITSKYSLQKYISHKKGKLYLRKMTLRKFLERLESALIDYENNRRQTKQVTFAYNFSQQDVLPIPEINFEKFFGKDAIDYDEN
jgi:hypothetical protein